MSFVEIIPLNVILHVGTTRISIAVFYYFLLGEICFIVITIQSTSVVVGRGGGYWCGRPRQQTAGGGKMHEEGNILNGITGFHALENFLSYSTE
jgi:hypothetical protein